MFTGLCSLTLVANMSAVDLTGVWLGADDVLTRCVARLLQSDLIVFKYYMCGACFSKFTRITTF